MTMTFVENSATISTTEYSLPGVGAGPTAQTDDCILQTYIDFGNMVAGDEYRIRFYEKVIGGGTQRKCTEWVLSGAQASPGFVMPTVIVGNGWDVTVQKLAGTDRSIAWSLRKVT